MKNKIVWSVFTAVMLMVGTVWAEKEARVLRFPTIHKNRIVFTYAGDLYTVAAQGGIARKLTSHEGYESFARFSPDGLWVAFTGVYDGNREVFVMPSDGGVPRRLTYTPALSRDDISDRMGPNNIVMSWKHDNQHIAFRSRMKDWNDFNGQLYLTSLRGDIAQQIPVPRGGFCTFSPDDKKMAYNRIFREFRTFKRYRGGMADDIWIYDFESKQVENITKNLAQDIIPMWSGNNIYFLSDRDENKKMNLYVMDLSTRETSKLTDFTEFDIKFPSLGGTEIVYENGGYIYRYNLKTEENLKVSIRIADDLNTSRSKIIKTSDRISNYEISPDGKRALFGARGEVFTVPAKHGNIRNLTNTSGVHERNSKWSPDGKWIAFISDKSGEDEIYIVPQDGSGLAQQLTSSGDTYKYQIYWSPDSKKIMWSDKKLRLNYLEVETKQVVEVASAEAFEINSYVWSPGSQWIAYSQPEAETMNKVYLYSLKDNKSYAVTEGWYSSYAPMFHSGGEYLFFVSDRDFNPIYSRTEWNHAYQSMARIYLVTLSRSTTSPFEPKSDEVEIKTDSSSDKDKPESKEKNKESGGEKIEPIKVDPKGLANRIVRLPVRVADYQALASVGDSLFYMVQGDSDIRSSLKMYDLKAQKETDLGSINGYEISADQKMMLVSQNQSYAIIPLPKSPIEIKEKLDLTQMEINVNLREEWNQIFRESWRQMKYFFYAPNMHDVDWDAMKTRYQPLAEAVNHRADLAYVIGEMIGELSVGHTYVGGGDFVRPARINVGRLGAQVEREESSRFYRITRIYSGQNWDSDLRSPLTEMGVDAKVGEYIIAINNKLTSQMSNLFQSLINTTGKQVTLKMNSKPEQAGSREVVVVPINDERALNYFNWVQGNIAKVNKATQGKVGYLHVPDMGRRGLNEFVKYFYPQLRKKALIIDVRGNGGGNVSPMLIERLRREIVMIDMARNTVPNTDPGAMLWGPKVCLMDEFSASDGDLFPYRFRQLRLGKLIGKRTWGGVVGIRGSLPFVDGGSLQKPEFAPYSIDGKKWIIEGIGVEPDIYVDNDPAKEFAGIDEQLNKAIEVILEELKTKEKNIPPIPPYPKKKK